MKSKSKIVSVKTWATYPHSLRVSNDTVSFNLLLYHKKKGYLLEAVVLLRLLCSGGPKWTSYIVKLLQSTKRSKSNSKKTSGGKTCRGRRGA